MTTSIKLNGIRRSRAIATITAAAIGLSSLGLSSVGLASVGAANADAARITRPCTIYPGHCYWIGWPVRS
jgi:hypothetical protein